MLSSIGEIDCGKLSDGKMAADEVKSKCSSWRESCSICDLKSVGIRRDGLRLKPCDSLKEEACEAGLKKVIGVRGSEMGDISGVSDNPGVRRAGRNRPR